MIIPEKIYTDNPFVDNIIYNTKYIAMNCTVKDDDEAINNETAESIRNGDALISSIEETANYYTYTKIPKEILEKYIKKDTNLNLFIEDIEYLNTYLSSLNKNEKNILINKINKTARNVYMDHYTIMVHYVNKIGINWATDNEELYTQCINKTINCTDEELFNIIPKYTLKRIIKTYIPDVQDINTVIESLNSFTSYISSRPILNIQDSDSKTKLDYISQAMRDTFISHYNMMVERGYVKDAYDRMSSFINIPYIHELAKNNNINFIQLWNYFPEEEIKKIINNKFSIAEITENNLYDLANLISYIVPKGQLLFLELNNEFIQSYINNYQSYLNSNIYARCSMGTIDFYELFKYMPKETQKMILNTHIDEYTNIQSYSNDKNLLDKYISTLPPDEAGALRTNIANDMIKWYPDHYEELNNYYRSFIGLPPIDDSGYVYEDTLIHSYDEKTKSFKEFGTKFIDKIMEVSKIYPELHWRQKIYEFDTYDINILNEYGILEEYVAECGTNINDPRYRYLKYLGDNKLDIYTCRRAVPFQLIGVPTVSDEEALKKFTDIYSINRNYCMHVVYSEAHKFKSDYYNKFFIAFILINTIMDMLADISSLIINRQVFDSRCIKWIFESYSIPFYSEIPFKYQKAMLLNLNNLLKYKSSVKNMIDICKLFGFSDVKVFNYYLFKQTLKDQTSGEYIPPIKYNKINYDLENIYVRINISDFISQKEYDISTLNAIDLDSDIIYYNILSNQITGYETIHLNEYDLQRDYNGINYMKLLDYIKYYENVSLSYNIIDIDTGIDAIELEGGKISNIQARDLSNYKVITNLSAVDVNTNDVYDFDALSMDQIKYYNITNVDLDGYDIWYLYDEELEKYYKCLDKYTEKINYIDNAGIKRTKRIIKNNAELYIKDSEYNDFILIKDLDYFTKINASLNPSILKFIKVPEGELLTNYKDDPNYIVSYDDIVLNDEGDTWDGGLDHKELYNKLLDHEFTITKTKYISIETLTDLTEQAFQISYFYNMLFDNLYSEEQLTVKIPYIKAGHSFKFMDIICYAFSLMYLYNGVNDNIMYSPTQILYIKGYEFDDAINALGYQSRFENKDIRAFNLEANVDELDKWVQENTGLNLDNYIVDDNTTVRDFFSLNNSYYQSNLFKDNVTALPYNQELKLSYDIILYEKIYETYYDNLIHSYIYENDSYIEIINDIDGYVYIMDNDYYVGIIDTYTQKTNNYSLYYKYTLINNEYIKNNNIGYFYKDGNYYKIYDMNDIYISDSNNRCIFSTSKIYIKNQLDEYEEFTDERFFNNNKLLLGDYWVFNTDDGKYHLNKDHAYIKVTINGEEQYISWNEVSLHQDIIISEDECYIKHSDGHFILFSETDYFRTTHPEGIIDTNIGDKIYEYDQEDLYVVCSSINYDDYEILENGETIYYKKLKNFYDENRWIYNDDLYININSEYISESELLHPDNCYYLTSKNTYELIINNFISYNENTNSKNINNILVLQNTNEYSIYEKNNINNFSLINTNIKYVYNSDTDYITGLSNIAQYEDTKTLVVVFNKTINEQLNSMILERYNPEETDKVWDENDWFYEDINNMSNDDIGISGENIWYYRNPNDLSQNEEDELEFNNIGCGFYMESLSYIDNEKQITKGTKYYMSFDVETNFTGKIQIFNTADSSVIDFKSRVYEVSKGEKIHVSQVFTANNNMLPEIRFTIYDLDLYSIEAGDYVIVSNISFIQANTNNFISTDILSYEELQKLYNTNEKIYKYLVNCMNNESNINKYRVYKKMYDSLMISKYNKEAFKISNNDYAKTYTDFLETRDAILYSRLIKYKQMDESLLKKEIADEIIEIIYVLEECIDEYTNQYIYSKFPGVSPNNIQNYLIKIINWFKSWKVHLLGINNAYKLSNKYENYTIIRDDYHFNTDYDNIRSNVFIYDTIRINPLEDLNMYGERYSDIYNFDRYTQSNNDSISIKDRIRIIDSTANAIEYKDYGKDLHIIFNNVNNKVYVNNLDLHIKSINDSFSEIASNLIMTTDRNEQQVIYGQLIDEINLFTNDYIGGISDE